MREELLEYYVRELTYLRQMGADFAHKYPGVARRLLLEEDNCGDPHVERLLEGFAFLAARVHRRIDDDFPELSESLLKIVHPSYLRPLPSMTIVECLPDPGQGKKTAGVRIPRGTELVSKATVEQLPCKFRTAYDVDLWPISVDEAEWRQPERMQRPVRTSDGEQPVAAARLRLKCLGDVVFEGLPLEKLRFHLSGDANVVYTMYEFFSERCIEIQLRDTKDSKKLVALPAGSIHMVGFGANESLLPYERRSTDGYRLLQEYFAFPDKFLFLDISGLEALTHGSFGNEVEIIFLFSKFERPERQQGLELGVNAKTFRLGCTPAVNLFKQTAEPILVNQTKYEYTIIPDSKHSAMMEIFSIEEVLAANPKLRQSVVLEHMHAYRHKTRKQDDLAFWTATRHRNDLGDREPSVMTISVVDLSGQVTDPEADVLTVRTLCTNFDLPTRFSFGAPAGDFEAVGHAAAKTVTALKRPTPTVDPPAGTDQTWRLISLLSLNYLSLTEGGRGALQEILRLHNLAESSATENQIGAIVRMESSPHFALVDSDFGLVPARGTLVEMELDEQQFAGGGAHLFTAVVDRFLAGYCSMNSFTQLIARSTLRKEVIAQWPPRSGTQVLL
jgi:type VI secretion system protein ImpG